MRSEDISGINQAIQILDSSTIKYNIKFIQCVRIIITYNCNLHLFSMNNVF